MRQAHRSQIGVSHVLRRDPDGGGPSHNRVDGARQATQRFRGTPREQAMAVPPSNGTRSQGIG